METTKLGVPHRWAGRRTGRSFLPVFTVLLALLFVAASVAVSVHGRSFVQPTIRFPIPFSAVLFVTLLLCFLQNRTTRIPLIPPGLLLVCGLLVLSALASSLWYQSRMQAAVNWLVLQSLILCFAFYAIFTLRRAGADPLLYFIRFLIGFGLASLAFALVLFACGSIPVGFAQIEQLPGYMRLYGWYGNPNLFGSAMGVATLAAYAMLMDGPSIRSLPIILFLCLFAGAILAGSKAVLASVTVAILLAHAVDMMPKLRPGYPIPRKPWRIAAIGVLLLALLAPFFIILYDVFEEILKLDNQDITSGRLHLWRAALEILKNADDLRILLGHGFEFHLDATGVSTHSFYVRAVVEHGFIFTIIFVAANLSLIALSVFRVRSPDPAQAFLGRFVLLVVVFMLLRNGATPSFLQVRVENIVYLFCIALFFSPRAPAHLGERAPMTAVSGRSGAGKMLS